MALTAKQRLFVAAYLDCLNATEAARRAGYAAPAEQGYENLRKPQIADAIAEGFERLAMPRDEILHRLTTYAQADIRGLLQFDDAGEMTGLRLHRDAPLHLIKSLTPTKYGWRVELHDAFAALSTLAKGQGVLVEQTKSELNINITGIDDDDRVV